MRYSVVLLGELLLLSQVFGLVSAEEKKSHFSTYRCNSTSYTLLYSGERADGAICRGCLSNETKLPICQRRLYAPIASCKEKSGRISFELRSWPTGSPPDSQGSQPANLTNDGDSERRLVFQPSKHALVVDFDDLSFIQYLGFSFKWNSSLSTLQFMVDYSVDGLHWSDYVEDERVKVFKIPRSHPSECLCRKLLARFLRIKVMNESRIGTALEGHFGATYCPTFSKLSFDTNASSSASMNYTRLYLGCYTVSAGNPGLFYSGLVGYTEIDQRVCIKRCADLGYSHAAIQSGLLCFCGNDVPSVPTNQSECLLPHISEHTNLHVVMRFYRIPTTNISVNSVSFPHKRRRLGEIFTIKASVNNREMGLVRFTVDFGDGNQLSFCDSPATYFYKNPGRYRVFLTVEDLKGNRLGFNEDIEIADNVTKLVLKCPKAIPQGTMVRCTATIARGLNVTGALKAENKQTVLQQIPDSRMSRVGENFPRHLPSTPAMLDKLLGKPKRTYLLTGGKIEEEGYLAVLEFIVIQPGPIHVQVWRHIEEQKMEEDVIPQNVIQCTEPMMFYLDHGACLSSSPSNPGLQSNQKFTVVSDIILVQHMSEGYHSVDLTNITQVKVLPGDMLAWLSSNRTGKIAIVSERSRERGRIFEGIVDDGLKEETLGPGLQSVAFNETFALSAQVVPLSSFDVVFKLDEVGIHPVQLTLRDSFGNTEVDNEEVVYQRGITNLTLNLPEFALVGEVTFGLSITNGTNVTYIWHFGDNQTKEIFNETSVTHTYASGGAHKVSVIAFNEVTIVQSECTRPYLLYAVKNLSIPYIKPVIVDANFTILVILAQGNQVDLNITLGDESPEFNLSKVDVKDSFVVAINHSYSSAGVFTVRAFAKNIFSNTSALLSVEAQWPVTGFNISAPQGVHSSAEDLAINMSVTQGTNVQYSVTLEIKSIANETNVHTKAPSGNSTTVVFPKEILRPGFAIIKAKVSNLVSWNESTKNIRIETPITDASLGPPPGAVVPRKAATFQFYYRTGSNMSITFWKNIAGASTNIKPGKENLHWWISSDAFKYADPGVYTARVNYSNVFGYVVVERTVIVQEPVRGIEVIVDRFIPLPPGILNVIVKQNGTLATNATVLCSYGDGTNESLDFTEDFNASHRYAKGGDYRLVVNVSNLGTSESKEYNVAIVKIVTFLIINAKSSADKLSSESFSSSSGDAFPFEFSVRFGVEHDGDPRNNVSFHFDFGDGNHFNDTSTDVRGEHTYLSTGEFIVRVTVRHQFGEFTNSTKITLKESLAGLTISDDAPTVVNELTTFTLNWDKFGTRTLIKVDLGDGTEILFGENINNVDSSSMAIFRPIDPSQKYITFGHTYKELRIFDVKVNGWNNVSSMSLSHRTVDVEEECRYPAPVISGVGADPQTALNVSKDREVIIYAQIVINCKASYETVFDWEAYSCDDSANKSMPIIINMNFNKSSLIIPPHSLPNGLIWLRFHAKMIYFIDAIESHVVGYINVLPGKLKARMSGGNVRTVGSQRPISIDGSISKDSDIKGGNLSGIQFYWFCRGMNESFPREVEDLPSVNLANPSMNSGNYGCEGSGPRMLNYSTPVWEIRPGVLREGESYVVKLVIRKDTREATFEQTVQVVAGVPPEAATGCEINCDDKVNTQNQLSVSCSCSNCDQEGFNNVHYQWEQQKKDKITGHWSTVHDLQEKAMTDIHRKNVVIRKGTLIDGRNYRLICRVKNEDGVEGRSEHHFLTNTPPQNGYCFIYPTEGKVLQTFFQIKCPGWHDEDGYDTYKVYRGERLLQHGNQPVLTPMLLPLGSPEKNYAYELTVKIFDKYGSFSTEVLSVKVTEAALSRDKLPQMLTSKDGLLKNMQISGNTQGVAQLVSSVASALSRQAAQEKLNQDGGTDNNDNNKGGNSIEDSEAKNTRIQMKEQLLGALETLEPESIDTLGVMVESMATVSYDVEEVSTTSQLSVLSILTTTVSTLSEKKTPDSLEAIESVGAGVMENIGNLFGASNYQQDKNARRVALLQEDVQNNVQSQDNTQEVAALEKEGEELKENARKVTKAAMNVLNNILDMLSDYLVVGQDAQVLTSESMSALLMKIDVKDLAGANVSIAGGSFVLPAEVKDMFASLEDPNCYITAKGLNAKDNPYSWDNSSSAVESNCLGLEFEDCYGNQVKVANLTAPIVITIPRQEAGEAPEPGNFTIEERVMKSHKMNIEDSSYSIHAVVHPEALNCSHKLRVFLRVDERPTTEAFDFNWTIAVIPGVVDWSEGFSLSVSNLQLNNVSSGSGLCYLGVYAVVDDESQMEDGRCSELNYTLFTFVSSCNFWDEVDEKWKGYGCEVGSKTTFDSTVCRCTHLTKFGGGFFVAPNPIDFDAAFKGFTDIASNPAVFATVITVFGLYLVGAIWARWRDKKDLEKVGVTPLLSNDPRDTYGYEITLQTGFQQKRRTTADVFIQLIGTLGDSEPRMLKDPKRPKFGRGEIDQFLLTVPQSLGNVREIHIWHNNAGQSPSWYLFRVLIRDLQTDTKWWFVCDRWLAVEEGDGAVDRRLHLATKEELTKFNILFVNATRKNLLDGHLWLSVFTRPPKSTFTRVQRLSCCLSLLLSTMLANLMFYQVGADDNSTASQSIHIGPFIFSVKQIMIGVQSSFVVLPVNMIIVTIFRKLKPKEDKSKSQKYEEVEDEEEQPQTISPKLTHEELPDRVDEGENEHSKKVTFSWRTIASLFKRDEESDYDRKKAKKRFLFPHWCIYIAYVLVVLSSLTCGLFCMLYGFTFGKEKSEKWLTSMFVSFFQSVVVIQPFKVLLLAAFFALVIKDPNKEEEQENIPDPALNTDEELITTDADKDTQRFSLNSKPPDAKKLDAARKLKLKQSKMKDIIKEIITHFLVVCVVLIVAYGNHDDRAFSMSNEAKIVLVEGGPNRISFDVINTKELFWDWAITSLVPSLYPSRVSHEYPYVGIMTSGKSSNVLGIGRIRQLRITKDTCQVPQYLSSMIPDCKDFYSWSEEEMKDFGKGWSDPAEANETESKETETKQLTSPWHYQSVMEANSFPYMGKISSYRGGGFIVQLGPDDVTALDKLHNLEATGWIDRFTRALFTELSVYNVNINLLCVVTLLYEELPTGGGQTFVNIQTIRVYRYIGNFSAALMASEVIFAFLLLRWMVRDGKRLWNERKAFWKKVWNVVDIAITILSITALALYFSRLVFLNSAINKVREDRSKFVSFQYVVLLNEGVNAMIAFVVLLLNLKFLRMLRFNRKISVFSSTLKVSLNKLAGFLVMFLVIFLAYCFLVWLVFGSVLEDYRSIIRCMVSMMDMVLGNFNFYDLVDVNRIIGPAVFFTFMIIFQFIIINMFIGILCDSFNDVRTDAVKQSNEYEILEFMSNRVKAFLGLFVEPPIRPEYNWPKSDFEKKVETIEEKAETTMFFMRNLVAEDVRQMKWFEPGKWSRKKSMVMSLVLTSDAEIMENDLCDGVEAMNTIIEKYSENELDRMLLASRMRRRSSMFTQNTGSTLSVDDESDDSEAENQYSDDAAEDFKNVVIEDGADEKIYKHPEEGKDEHEREGDQDEDEEEEEGEEEEKMMEEIEEEIEENDEDGEEKGKDAVEWEEEIESQLGILGSFPSHNSNSNSTVYLNRVLPPVPMSPTNLGNKENDSSIEEINYGLPKPMASGLLCVEVPDLDSERRGLSPSMPKNHRATPGGIGDLGSNVGNNDNNSCAAKPIASGVLSVEVHEKPPTTPAPAFTSTFGDCTTIFIKETADDRIPLQSHSEA